MLEAVEEGRRLSVVLALVGDIVASGLVGGARSGKEGEATTDSVLGLKGPTTLALLSDDMLELGLEEVTEDARGSQDQLVRQVESSSDKGSHRRTAIMTTLTLT